MGQETVMMDHEGRLGAIEANQKTLDKNLEKNTKVTEDGFTKIENLLQPTIVQVALNKQSTGRLWKVVMPLALMLLAAAGTQVFSFFK